MSSAYLAGTEGAILSAVWGLVFGSFLGAASWRLPRGESLWWPPSHCPTCGRRLPAAELVPVLSFLAQRGRCRGCGQRIPWRYPAVEALTAGLWAAVALIAQGRLPQLAAGWTLCGLAVATAVTDLETRRVPNALTGGGAAVWAILQALLPWHSLAAAVGGAAVFGGVLLVAALLWPQGMGWGDVKLGAVLGLLLGWRLAFLGLELAVLGGAAFAASQLLLRRRRFGDALPLAPWLGAGAVTSLLAGPRILAWYLHLVGMR